MLNLLQASEIQMGRETTLQGLPESSRLMNDFRSGTFDVQTAFCFLSWSRRKHRETPADAYFANEDDPERTALFLKVLQLLELSPQLLWQYCDLDRRFEVILYLLCETTECESQQELFRRAICGSSPIHPKARGGQGFPIMWNDSKTTDRIHESLDSVDFGELALHYHTAKFQKQSLYKQSDDRRELTYLYQYFCGFKEFYRSAAQNGNATIVLVD